MAWGIRLVAIAATAILTMTRAPAEENPDMHTDALHAGRPTSDVESARTSCSAKPEIPGIQSPIEMPVPVKEDERTLGNVPIRLGPDEAPALSTAELTRLLDKILNNKALARVKDQAGNDEMITLNALCAAALPATFNTTQLTVSLEVPLESRKSQAISLTSSNQTSATPDVTPAELAAYANLFFGIDHIAYSDFSQPGWTSPNIGIDGAIRWQDLVVESEFTLAHDLSFKRRRTRLIYDLPGYALRFKAGDLRAEGTYGHSGRNMLGLSLERSYTKLKPGKKTRPNARRSFVVYQTSDVDVFVNGRLVRSLRFPPGEYQVSDLPLTTGGNQIKVEVTEDSGRVRTYKFEVFYDHALLAPGLSEWSIHAGFTTEYDINGRQYAFDRPALHARYRRGLKENLTGELALQAADGLASLDGSLTSENTFGSLFLRGGVSYADGAAGYSMGFDWQFDDLADWSGPLTVVRLSADYDSQHFGLKKGEQDPTETFSLAGAFGFQLPLDIHGFASLNYVHEATEAPRLNANLSLSKSVTRSASWSLSAGYHQGPTVASQGNDGLARWSARFGLDFQLGHDARMSVDHDIVDRSTQLELDKNAQTETGHWATEVVISTDKAEDRQERAENGLAADLRYTADRFIATAGHARRFHGLGSEKIDIRSSATLSTGLAFADGKFAWGRPINGAFAIVDLPAGLKRGELQVSPSSDGAVAEADALGPALVSGLPPYVATTLPTSANDVPQDYDPGRGAFTVKPGYKAGYKLIVGSTGTLSVRGRLVDDDGEPLGLEMGEAQPAEGSSGKSLKFFTGRDGSFFIQGLAPGTWSLHLREPSPSPFAFKVSPSKQRIVDVGRLQPVQTR